ncbi:hypothetical protein [Erwinia aphidicola]
MYETNEIKIWPDSNCYLRKGIECIARMCTNVDIKQDYLFIDFSAPNLRLFTNNEWIDRLRTSGLKIILICDSIMEPLAEYWVLRDKRIYTAIYTDCNISKVLEILTLSAYCSHTSYMRKIKRLNREEVFHIDLSLRGHSPIQISQILKLTVKKVYNIKQAINRKLRKDIGKIMLNQ